MSMDIYYYYFSSFVNTDRTIPCIHFFASAGNVTHSIHSVARRDALSASKRKRKMHLHLEAFSFKRFAHQNKKEQHVYTVAYIVLRNT